MKQVRVPELMDDPALDEGAHAHALKGLRRLNVVSGTLQSFWRVVRDVATRAGEDSISILDVATGGGDIPIWLATMGQQTGMKLSVFGCDISETAVKVASQKAVAAKASVQFFQLDVLHEPLPRQYDLVINSLFLHHLDTQQVIHLLSQMNAYSKKMLVVNDLERSVLSYVGVWLACHALSNSHVVRYDGPVSVRAAYTVDEIRSLTEKAGLQNVQIRRHFPCRFLLTSGSAL